MSAANDTNIGTAGAVARVFVDSKLTPLLIVGSVLLGLLAIVLLPREEEPQIKVPMVDVMITMEGASAKEVESRVSAPLERLLREIPGVEYVYTTSLPGRSLAIVRFRVGDDVERSLVKLNQKLQSNYDRIPSGVSEPLIKVRSIDDVPILALTLHSAHYDHLTLRRLAAEIDARIKRVPEVAETTLVGGATRRVRIELDPARLAAHGLGVVELGPMLTQANRQSISGSLTNQNRALFVETGGFFRDAGDVAGAVVGVSNGVPVYVRDVATVVDGADEATQYVLYGTGSMHRPGAQEEPAVTLAIAKRPNTNAIDVANAVLAQVDALRGTLIPTDVEIAVTRHYGDTAAEKANELLFHMAIAVVSVSLLVFFMLGFRESAVVAVAIPSTLALTLLVFHLVGYTLNRITLFALIFSIGILVDDAIVIVENIVRHRDLEKNRGRRLADLAVDAVAEVGNPTILATLAVIAAILPMAFVGGLMGPYMRPTPVGASAAMVFSLIVAFVVTPWAAARILRPAPSQGDNQAHRAAGNDMLTRGYRWIVSRLLMRSAWRWSFLAGTAGLLGISMALVPTGVVQVKMLPFDNKSELQLILNMPEGSALEQTARVAREMAASIRELPEVRDYQVYVGTAAPFNLNGLVRHYYLRGGASSADVQVNLVAKHEREAQSHTIAERVRPLVASVAERYGARVTVAEVPPGPPLLQTLVAELYAPDDASRQRLAEAVREIFKRTPGVVDVDWYVEEAQPLDRFVIDKHKAALHGISGEAIAATLQTAVSGRRIGLLHLPGEQEDVDVQLELARQFRGTSDALLALRVRAQDGALVPLRELVLVEHTTKDRSIYHKNLLPVIYVTADVAGSIESSAYAVLAMKAEIEKLKARDYGGSTSVPPVVFNFSSPASDVAPAIKWDGEWQMTYEVFRDLGAAFAVVLVLIYVLLVGWFRSFLVPLVVMAAIPFSLVGILPAHAAMGAFFSATSMVGFMAGAGIVVRNSIILVDFAQARIREGMSVRDAVIEAGAVRFRPMLLTAMAVVVGAAIILFDPIFQGLALSLMAGEVASLLISRLAVPVLYELVARYTAQGAESVPRPSLTDHWDRDTRPRMGNPKHVGVALVLTVIVSLPLAARASASPAPPDLVDRQLGGVIDLYKWFHKNPEISGKEEKTAARFAAELRTIGWKTTEKVGGYGVVAVLANGSGPTVLVRVDLDALPIQEETGLAYASKNGAMHACGHDAHMAAGIGVARALTELRSRWAGTVVLIGQPAEETGVGARDMLADPKFRAAFSGKPAAALSIHDTHYLPAGAVALCSGQCTSYVDHMEITFFGRGGHSGAPEKAINPIAMAAELVTELQTVASTRISPLQRGAIGVNAIHAGNKNGIIPEKATLLVTVRALESDTHDTLLSDTRYVAERIAEMHHAPSPPDIKVASSYVAGTQDPVFARQASEMLKPVLGEIGEFAPLMVGEDFYELARHFGIPALQVRVGGVPPRLMQPGATPPSQHSSTWAPEPEPMLRSGVLALTTLCLGLLGAPTS